MRRLAAAAALALLVLALGGQSSWASCAAPIGTPAANPYASAPVVFVGTVRSTSHGDRVARVRVEAVWRGPDLPETVEVRGASEPVLAAVAAGGQVASSDERVFRAGEGYLFAPDGWRSPFRDGACSLTRAYAAELGQLAPADARRPLAAPPAGPAPSVDARIQVVWPHLRRERDAVGSELAFPLANVEVYLFERGTLNPVGCDFPYPVRLRWALNDGGQVPSHHFWSWWFARTMPDGAGARRVIRTVEGKTFPVWLFEDVPSRVNPERWGSERERQYFFGEVEGAEARTNVWAHALDARTSAGQLLPTRVGPPTAEGVDALVQIVWPHDRQGVERPVAEGELVNVAVDLFTHPVYDDPRQGPAAVGFGFDRPVRLLRALNDGSLEPVATGQVVRAERRLHDGGPVVAWPRWVFNDVDVSAARDPANRYFFAARVEGLPTHSTVWAHGADGRTIFPRRDAPARSGAGC